MNKENPGGLNPINNKNENKVFVLNLESRKGKSGELTFRFNKDRILIGSVVAADIRLTGVDVAPVHAVIEWDSKALQEDSALIYDVASETGVFVNEQKIITERLKSGDKIRIGTHLLSFSMELVGSDAQSGLRSKNLVKEFAGRRLFLDPNEDMQSLLLEDETRVHKIFDYTSTKGLGLEIVMSWRDTILKSGHFVRPDSITLGYGRKNDFWTPPVLSTSRFPLIVREKEDYILNFDNRMKGVLYRKGELQSLDQIRLSAKKGPHGFQISLDKDDFAKVSVGEIDFYVSFAMAPPRLRKSGWIEKDPFFFRLLATSLGLTGLVILAVINSTVLPKIEAEQIPERVATILYQPEKFTEKIKPIEVIKEEPKQQETKPEKRPPPVKKKVKIEIVPQKKVVTKPIPKEMNVVDSKNVQAKPTATIKKKGGATGPQAGEGAGQKVAGKEGTRGSQTGKKTVPPQNLAVRPTFRGDKGAAGASQVRDQGNVDLLKSFSGKIENLLGNSAQKLGKGGEKLKGFGLFDSVGSGGSALSGGDKGGGGTVQSLEGLSDHGSGGGRIGTGKGAFGSGHGIIGQKARVSLRAGGGEDTIVFGSIDKDAIDAAIRAHRDEFRLCYEKEVNAESPKLAGRVGTSFIIGSSGRVTQAGISSTSLRNSNVERCILVVLKRIEFPIPRGAGIVEVLYPFKFEQTGGK